MQPRYKNLKKRSYNTYRVVTINNVPKVKIETVEQPAKGPNGWLWVGVFVAGIIGKLLIIGMI